LGCRARASSKNGPGQDLVFVARSALETMEKPTLRHLTEIRDGFSGLPLFLELGKLNGSATPEKLVDFSLKYPAISPLQLRSELVEYARIVAELRPRTVLEIGTYHGGTLFIHSRLASPNATLISIDLPGSLLGRLWRWMHAPIFNRFTRRGQEMHLLRADSHRKETLSTVSKLLDGRQLDLLFVDGDHSYAGVRADFEMYASLVRPGGVVAFHDIAVQPPPSEVARFWNQIKLSYPHREILHGTGKHAMGIGVVEL
jgi:cephalosporin hydroxylase